MSIEIQNINKRFDGFHALRNVNLTVPSGELVALLGPSGSGKTTLLRIIAGLEFAEEGTILFNGEEATHRNAKERQVGFVFQHYALFRHMTVFQNVAFGLQVKPRKERLSKGEISDKVHELLRLVQLEQLAKRYPAQLSGGQRQRVALARALAVEPQVLLLDEPFGALDAKVRQELRRWLRKLHDEIHVTSLFVTHDQEEALEVADRIVVMNEGQVEQIGTPEEVYDKPANPFVLNFLGNVNLFHGRVHEGAARIADLSVDLPAYGEADGTAVVAYVRPYDIEINRSRQGSEEIEAVVRRIQGAGAVARFELERLDTREIIEAELTKERYRELGLRSGEKVFVKPRNMRVFAQDYQI
ncbi:MAG: sulfate ABC transporter ATP-binding protein [Deltaproteobacteria bacterium]|nr:sulfate ABC transporter ATP-binding protein [Deltaproteobacteria bacterium]TLN02927.1 MAG: sulfate ABC transporter ATP-binding protein [bacterium]